jgi:hypothetical protein
VLRHAVSLPAADGIVNSSHLERTLSGPRSGGVEPIFRPPPRAGYNPDMSILIPCLVVAFAAFCVWLAVRIVNRQERWAKRTAVGLFVVLVGYPLSIGPACWLSSRVGCGAIIVTVIYRPLLGFVPTPATGMLTKYSAIATPDRMPGMSEERKRAGAGFWITVTVVAVSVTLVAYPLSTGPAEWMRDRRFSSR